jgi:hypothetical protein
MQPQRDGLPTRQSSTAPITDPAARQIIGELLRKVADLERRLQSYQQSRGPLKMQTLSGIRMQGGRLLFEGRNVVYGDSPQPEISPPFTVLALDQAMGGGGGTINQNITIANETVGTITPHGHQGLRDGGFLGDMSGGL